MRLPNIRLVIPTPNATLVKSVPEFVVPLYKAVWRGSIDDPHGDPIKTYKIPNHPKYDYCRYTYADSLNAYRNRLFAQFSGSARSDGRAIYEAVFPDEDSFEAAVNAWASKNGVDIYGQDADVTEEDDVYTPNPGDEDVRAVKGIGNSRAQDLAGLLQIRTVGQLAEADVDAVSRACTISVDKAQAYIDAAQLRIDEQE